MWQFSLIFWYYVIIIYALKWWKILTCLMEFFILFIYFYATSNDTCTAMWNLKKKKKKSKKERLKCKLYLFKFNWNSCKSSNFTFVWWWWILGWYFGFFFLWCVKIWFFFFFLKKSNINAFNVYVCETPPWKFEFQPWPVGPSPPTKARTCEVTITSKDVVLINAMLT